MFAMSSASVSAEESSEELLSKNLHPSQHIHLQEEKKAAKKSSRSKTSSIFTIENTKASLENVKKQQRLKGTSPKPDEICYEHSNNEKINQGDELSKKPSKNVHHSTKETSISFPEVVIVSNKPVTSISKMETSKQSIKETVIPVNVDDGVDEIHSNRNVFQEKVNL